MAAASVLSTELQQELICSICLSLFQDPVLLNCGHNFCQDCLEKVWEAQSGGRGYSCPECRREYREKPALHRNLKLCNIVERFKDTQEEQNAVTHPCDFCLENPLPAINRCINCEASLCELHLQKHNNKFSQRNHVLVEPIDTPKGQQSNTPECTWRENGICICVGHTIIPADMYQWERATLSEEVKKMQLARKKIEKALEDVQAAIGTLKVNRNSQSSQISNVFNLIRTELNRKEEEFLKSKASEENAKHLELKRQMENLNVKRETMVTLMRKAHDLSLQGDGEHFSRAFKPIYEKIQSLDTSVGTFELPEAKLGGSTMSRIHEITQSFINQLSALIEGKVSQLPGQCVLKNAAVTQQAKPQRVITSSSVTPPNTSLEKLLPILKEYSRLSLTFDPLTANSELILSNNYKMVTEVHSRGSVCEVKASEKINSGKYYWEVEILGNGKWKMEVVTGMFLYRKIEWDGSSIRVFQNKDKSIKESSSISSGRIVVLLNCEEGRLSFFHVGQKDKLVWDRSSWPGENADKVQEKSFSRKKVVSHLRGSPLMPSPTPSLEPNALVHLYTFTHWPWFTGEISLAFGLQGCEIRLL
ncbi:E3 ubiquitin/ISG15 ligase TRIM25-like [Latimeria chalumnae]|uniref:E3 ubiquitin/ISG15 ligase TRIM25-like n=1 Tax=Latimeria chalumnae TaxID=7897 RepID=UPI00313E9357